MTTSTTSPLLRVLSPTDYEREAVTAVDDRALEQTREIFRQLETGGERALRTYARQFSEIEEGESYLVSTEDLKTAFESLDLRDQQLLIRTKERIQTFAQAQRQALHDIVVNVPGGRAGHRVHPLRRAGCYAPGGRYPLPSSVLMTAVTARVAGVAEVLVCSPRPTVATLAAAHVAGVNSFLRIGGAHAIYALAYGCELSPACDVIVGPGNRWVTAAKKLVSGDVSIDMLAGPSELLIIADQSASPDIIAADLLAQAEHDPDAVPMLISLSAALPEQVDAALRRQLETLPTRAVAEQSLKNGFVISVDSLAQAIGLSETIAPEHLELLFVNATDVTSQFQNFGAIFVGSHSAEVFGDYGAGPNHVLPTGGTARSVGGLSVFQFLRVNTWLELDKNQDTAALCHDCVQLARMEGLEGHARAAEQRCDNSK